MDLCAYPWSSPSQYPLAKSCFCKTRVTRVSILIKYLNMYDPYVLVWWQANDGLVNQWFLNANKCIYGCIWNIYAGMAVTQKLLQQCHVVKNTSVLLKYDCFMTTLQQWKFGAVALKHVCCSVLSSKMFCSKNYRYICTYVRVRLW